MLLSLRFLGFFETFQEFAEAAFFLVENIDKSVNARFRNKPARESRKTSQGHRYDTVHRHHLVCRAFREDFCAENQNFFQKSSESRNRNLVDGAVYVKLAAFRGDIFGHFRAVYRRNSSMGSSVADAMS